MIPYVFSFDLTFVQNGFGCEIGSVFFVLKSKRAPSHEDALSEKNFTNEKKCYLLLAIISLYRPMSFANMIFSSLDAPSASFPISRTISCAKGMLLVMISG